MGEQFGLDLSELKALGKQIVAYAPELKKEFYAGLVAAGEIVASKARSKAAAFPRKGPGTTRIADSIRVRRRLTSVTIQAGGDIAPEAAALEHHGLAGTFRHPVPNVVPWSTQTAHPFLTPAAEESAEEVEAAVVGLMDVTLARMVV